MLLLFYIDIFSKNKPIRFLFCTAIPVHRLWNQLTTLMDIDCRRQSLHRCARMVGLYWLLFYFVEPYLYSYFIWCRIALFNEINFAIFKMNYSLIG